MLLFRDVWQAVVRCLLLLSSSTHPLSLAPHPQCTAAIGTMTSYIPAFNFSTLTGTLSGTSATFTYGGSVATFVSTTKGFTTTGTGTCNAATTFSSTK